jgi:hypothetical protein
MPWCGDPVGYSIVFFSQKSNQTNLWSLNAAPSRMFQLLQLDYYSKATSNTDMVAFKFNVMDTFTV